MNHYQTLGIQPEASADEVKHAWRRLSSKHHPDRDGGCAETMKAINQAYECLSDEGRRAAYDDAGFMEPAGNVERIATEALTEFFDAAIRADQADLVGAVQSGILAARRYIEANRGAAVRKRDKLRKQRERIRTRGGARNIAHAIIDPQIQRLDAEIAEADLNLLALEKAKTMLANYESAQDEEASDGGWRSTLVMGTGTGSSAGFFRNA